MTEVLWPALDPWIFRLLRRSCSRYHGVSAGFLSIIFYFLQTDPVLSLEVFFILEICIVAFRNGIHRFRFLLSAFCSLLLRVFLARKGQIGSDAVPHTVAHHVVTLAICAHQLVPVYPRDKNHIIIIIIIFNLFLIFVDHCNWIFVLFLKVWCLFSFLS